MIPKNKAMAERDHVESEVRAIEFALDEKILTARGEERNGPFGAKVLGLSQEAIDLAAKRYRDGGWYVSFTCESGSHQETRLVGMLIKFEPSELDLSHERTAAKMSSQIG